MGRLELVRNLTYTNVPLAREEWLLSRKVLWILIVRAIDRSSFTVVIAHIVIILMCSRGLPSE